MSKTSVSLSLYLLAALLSNSAATGQDINLKPNSTQAVAPLTGEKFQIFLDGDYFTGANVPGQTLSNYGVIGTDLGYPVVYPDKIVFLFGDTFGAYQSGSTYFVTPQNGDDSIGFIPNTDLSQCTFIPQVITQIGQGNRNPNVNAAGCPAIQFYENPNAGPKEHKFMTTTIAGLQSGEGTGTFETPSGAFDSNGTLYMFYVVQVQINANARDGHFALESILAKSTQPETAWTPTNGPTFTRLFQVSSHPQVADPNNPPSEAGAAGKFMFNPVAVMSNADLAAAGLLSGLPSPLQSAPSVVFVFGSSWNYNHSNLYLAAFSLSDADTGTSAWSYYAGTNGSNQWSASESAATPLFTQWPDIGNHSVVWNATLKRFVLMYGGAVVSFSTTPWGPWSNPQLAFDPNGDEAEALIHRTDSSPINRTPVRVYNADGTPDDLSSSDVGYPYAPMLINSPTANSDGSVTFYYGLSTWNPYEVLLMSSTFQPGAPPAGPIVSAASYNATAIAPGSLASYFGSGLAAAPVGASSTTLGTTLGGRQVQIKDGNGVSQFADMLYVSPGQVNFVVPANAADGLATISVMSGSTVVASSTAEIQSIVPAVFSADSTGSGAASAYLDTRDASGKEHLQPAFTCSSPSSCVTNPLDLSQAQDGAFLELYGTGIRNGTNNVSVELGTTLGKVLYSDAQHQYEGLDQVNVRIPASLQGAGTVTVRLTVNGLVANPVTVTFK